MQDLHPPWTLFESVASARWANGSCSPCLLVKGTDCAGDVLPVWGVVIDRSFIELRASMLPHMKNAPPVTDDDGEQKR